MIHGSGARARCCALTYDSFAAAQRRQGCARRTIRSSQFYLVLSLNGVGEDANLAEIPKEPNVNSNRQPIVRFNFFRTQDLPFATVRRSLHARCGDDADDDDDGGGASLLSSRIE